MKPSPSGTAFLAIALLGCTALAQQVVDDKFDPKIDKPTYAKQGPLVLFDEAHHNFHRSGERYKPFATLLSNDGYTLRANHSPFTKGVLSQVRIVVIANAAGGGDDGTAARPAFTSAEIKALRDWVRQGGALLLIADHAPFGKAAAGLAKSFGVSMTGGYAQDESSFDPDFGPSVIKYFGKNGVLGQHAIIKGRNEAEQIHAVTAFTGQSLSGPPGSTVLLRFSERARWSADAMPRPEDLKPVPIGSGQAIALSFGKGRAVVLGEAAMLTAQIVDGSTKIGMNVAGNDNRQFALNIVHWLSGVL